MASPFPDSFPDFPPFVTTRNPVQKFTPDGLLTFDDAMDPFAVMPPYPFSIEVAGPGLDPDEAIMPTLHTPLERETGNDPSSLSYPADIATEGFDQYLATARSEDGSTPTPLLLESLPDLDFDYGSRASYRADCCACEFEQNGGYFKMVPTVNFPRTRECHYVCNNHRCGTVSGQRQPHHQCLGCYDDRGRRECPACNPLRSIEAQSLWGEFGGRCGREGRECMRI